LRRKHVFEVAAILCLVTFLIANGTALARIRSGHGELTHPRPKFGS